MAETPKLFSRRRNRDGSYDAICLTCFATVSDCGADGTGTTHVCESKLLAERGIPTQPESGKRPGREPGRPRAYNRSGDAA